MRERRAIRQKFVEIPDLVTVFQGPRYLAAPLEHLVQAGEHGLTAPEMNALGCKYPPKVVYELRRRGVIIEIWRTQIFDEEFINAKRWVSLYEYQGFRPDCKGVFTVPAKAKELLCSL